MHLNDILKKAHENDASDIHLVANHVPMMRVHTVMTAMDFPILSPETMKLRFPARTTLGLPLTGARR